MKTILFYLFEVNIYLIIFYVFFLVFLRKEIYSRLNRYYLLGSCFMSLIIPLIYIPALSIINLSFLNLAGIDNILNSPELMQNTEFMSADPAIIESYTSSIVITDILLFIAGTISMFLIVKNVVNYYRILKIINKYGVNFYNNYKIIYTDNNSPIFSFLNYIFWNRRIDINKPEGRTIFNHEIIHVKEKHSLDLILFELLTVFLFYNPVIYFYKRSIRLIHEYIADNNIINENELTDNEYCSQLFNMTFSLQTNPLINNFFNNSNLKNRLKMITKTKSGKKSIGKLFLLIPLLTVILTISSCINITVRKTLITAPIPKNMDEEIIIKEYLEDKEEDKKTFYIVEDMPTFMKGNQNNSLGVFRNWISKNLKYPQIAKENGIEGTVHATFVINESGKISNVKILRPLDPALDAEAKRVLLSSPRWTPGKQRGRAVSVAMSIPIKFTLTKKGQSNDKQPEARIQGQKISKSEFFKNEKFRDMINEEIGDGQVFYIVEEMPTFMEGNKDNSLKIFRNWISDNLKYPAIAMEHGIEGTVHTSFVIDESGKVSNVKILRPLDPALDAEAKRAIMSAPRWTPGKQRGQAVKVALSIPVKFVLQ